MNLTLQIINDEDINYINNIHNDNKDKLKRTAISIGLKSIQMSEVKMDCHSYIDPIRDLIYNSTEINTNKINGIDDKLDDLLHIKTNSSRKGKLSEELCFHRLINNYPQWEFINVTQTPHEADCRAKNTPIGEILYEFKSYDTNVNKDQIKKFHNDLKITGIKFGIFVSNTSGIVGKKNLEWEIINNDILIIYISNIGFNGHGCILATELLLALVKNNIMDSKNYWLLYQNYNTNDIYHNLIDNFDDYKKNNELLNKYKIHIKDHRLKMNSMIDSLESEIFQLVLNTELTYNKMLNLVQSIKSETNTIQEFNLKSFILNNLFSEKFIKIFTQLYNICKNLKLQVNLNDNELFISKGNDIIAKTKTMKTKIQLYIIKYPKELNEFNPLYEEFNHKKLIIELNDNYKIWTIVQKRLG